MQDALLQAAETRIREEERTVPGEAPGIYACDYKKLAQIHIKVAEARIELLQGNMAGAEVRLSDGLIPQLPMSLCFPCSSAAGCCKVVKACARAYRRLLSR